MRTTKVVTTMLLLLALAGCATAPGRVEEVDTAQARALAEQGDFAGAALEYERLAARNRRTRDALMLLAAESLREEGDLARAGRYLQAIRRDRLGASEQVRYELLQAEVALAAGDAERALALATVADASLDAAQRQRAREIRASALAASGRPYEAVRERLALLESLPEPERAREEEALFALLATIEVAQVQAELARLGDDDALRPWLERSLRLRGSVPARRLARPTREVGTLLEGEAGWQREGYSANAPRVGVLLPLSGELGAAGRAVRDGFLAAYFADDGARPQLRFHDTGPSTAGALDAYRRAVADGSGRIVGPLAREQVDALFASVEVATPVLALNHPDDGELPPAGSQVFALLPDEEAAFAAERMIERGHRVVAVFAGDEDWSTRAAAAFRAQLEANGGVVAGEARLAGGPDFAPQIAAAVGGGVDAVFIAARPPQARLIVPQLRARGMTGVPVYATSHVYAGSPNRSLDRDLDGVEFCDAPWLFDLAAGMPMRERLARDLPAAQAAGRLFAFGMDAYRLLPYLDWLAANPEAYLAGASGQLSIDGFGRVRRVPSWFRFDDGVPRPADGALVTDAGPEAP